jgi:hypothetical protein
MADELKIAGWGPPPADLFLGDEEVHVWRGTVKGTAAELEPLLGQLSRRERREMNRHPAPKNYAAARLMIRSLLGRYLNLPPGKVKLEEGRRGRLVLAKAPQGPPHWDFGWGEDRAVFAISATQPLAVHLEVIPRDLDVSGWMRDLAPREASLIEFYSPQNRARFVVGYHAEREAERRLAAYQWGEGSPGGARLERLRLGKRFVAALAAEGWDWSPSFWRYPRPGPEDEDDGD